MQIDFIKLFCLFSLDKEMKITNNHEFVLTSVHRLNQDRFSPATLAAVSFSFSLLEKKGEMNSTKHDIQMLSCRNNETVSQFSSDWSDVTAHFDRLSPMVGHTRQCNLTRK